MTNAVAGFVIQGEGNLFLSRGMRFVHHRNREKTTGAERAWVHQISALSADLHWTKEAKYAFLARYQGNVDQTVILDEAPIPIDDFVECYLFQTV